MLECILKSKNTNAQSILLRKTTFMCRNCCDVISLYVLLCRLQIASINLVFTLCNHLVNLTHKADLYQITQIVHLEPLSYHINSTTYCTTPVVVHYHVMMLKHISHGFSLNAGRQRGTNGHI